MLEDIKEYLLKAEHKCKSIQNDGKSCYDCNYRKSLCDITDKFPYKILRNITELEDIEKIIPRKLVIPGTYRHFKHTDDGIPNNYMYSVVGISEPLEEKLLSANINSLSCNNKGLFKNTSHFYTNYTEDNNIKLMCFGFDKGHNFYHRKEILDKKVVIYISLCNGKQYVRPYDMFMSEVDHEKYPDVKQKYRFELVR